MSTADISIFTKDGFDVTLKIADAMVKSGILPKGIDTPYKAFAIIQKGREMGVEPMRALTGIYLIEGKTVVSPELKLECFRERGGRVSWVRSDNTVAELALTAANGDKHVETVTMDDMKAAGLSGKDNWRKYPKSMLRARCIAFALRAMGEGDGSYTPDELGAVTDEKGNAEPEYIPPAFAANTNSTARPARANTVKHDGALASKDQIAKLHVLKGKVGGLTDDMYRKQLAAFKREDGTPCEHSNELSGAQISNLLDRYEKKIQQQAARAEEVPDIGAIVPPVVGSSLIKLAVKHFVTDQELVEWLHGLFGVESLKDLDVDQSSTALALLMAMGTAAYDATEERARALGRIR